MNNKNAEWQREYYLTHDKYRMQGQGTDCYKVVKSLTRILQLPTIAKLTTDNKSVISDFRLNRGEYGLEPYDEYAIKVDDTYGASLYILVHRRLIRPSCARFSWALRARTPVLWSSLPITGGCGKWRRLSN